MGIVLKTFLVILVACVLLYTEVYAVGAVRNRARGKGPPSAGSGRAYNRVPFSRFGRGGLSEKEASGSPVMERDGLLRWAAAVEETLSALSPLHSSRVPGHDVDRHSTLHGASNHGVSPFIHSFLLLINIYTQTYFSCVLTTILR